MSKIVYIDMDGVLVDLQKELDRYGWYQNIFRDLLPMEGAVESFNYLCNYTKYDVYILSTAPWNMPLAWQHKRLWVSKYLGKNAHKRLILSNHKNLCHGDYLIDDRTTNGAGEFNGELIQFGTEKHPNWESVLKYLKENE